jgi:hypothetical protein
MAELTRRPHDWEHVYGIKVMDPDGWRPGARGGAKGWEEPITREEWEERMGMSTVDLRPELRGHADFTHNPWDHACDRRCLGEPTDPSARCHACRDTPFTLERTRG